MYSYILNIAWRKGLWELPINKCQNTVRYTPIGVARSGCRRLSPDDFECNNNFKCQPTARLTTSRYAE